MFEDNKVRLEWLARAIIVSIMLTFGSAAMAADICVLDGYTSSDITCKNGTDGTYSEFKVGKDADSADNYIVACALVSGVWVEVGREFYDTSDPPLALFVFGKVGYAVDETITIVNTTGTEDCGDGDVTRIPLTWFASGNSSINVYGDDGLDTITGSDRAEYIYGGLRDDTIDGNGGADIIEGNEGADDIYGGDGNDAIHGGDGADYIWGEVGADDLLGDGDADHIWGGIGDDYIEGGAAGDTLYGQGGDDDLYGGTGNDTIYGGDGDDYLWGEEDTDWCDGEADVTDDYCDCNTEAAGCEY